MNTEARILSNIEIIKKIEVLVLFCEPTTLKTNDMLRQIADIIVEREQTMNLLQCKDLSLLPQVESTLSLRRDFDTNMLPYNEEALQSAWYNRNPCHEIDENGTNRFWKTAFMSFVDYINSQLKK